jgi:hypothetical protein
MLFALKKRIQFGKVEVIQNYMRSAAFCFIYNSGSLWKDPYAIAET